MKGQGIPLRSALWGVALALAVLAASVTSAGSEEQVETALERAARLRREVTALREGRHWTEAIPKAREVLAITETVQGPTHLEVAESLSGLAGLLQRAEDYAGARSSYERALAIREQVLGPTHPEVADSLNSLGGLLRKTGDYPGARRAYERALAIREQELGPMHPSTASSVNNLATLLMAVGDYAGARRLYEKALTIREQELVATDRRVAQSLNDLAELLRTTGEYAAARPLYDRALKIREAASGPNHASVATSLNDLAGLLRATGDYAGARSHYERALAIRTKARGPMHLSVAETLNDMAVLVRMTGDYAAARDMYTKALAIRERALGRMHPEVAESLNKLAGLLRAMGDDTAAQPLYERALAIRQHALPPTHPDVAESLNSLAGLWRFRKDYAAARPLYERALALREQTLGASHPRVAGSLTSLATVLEATGDVERARAWYARALAIGRGGQGAGGRWRAAFGLGRIEENAGRLDLALPLYREAVRLITQISAQFGEEVRIRYLETGNKLEAYDALVKLLLRLHRQAPRKGYDREGWAVLEAKRGWVAADGLTGMDRQIQDPAARAGAEPMFAKQDEVAALDSELRAEQAKPLGEQVEEKIVNVTRLLAQTKADFYDESEKFLARYQDYRKLVANQRAVMPEDLATYGQRLPAGTLAVQYFSAPDALYIFVVGAGELYEIKEQSITQAELYGLVRTYRGHVERGTSVPLTWEDDGGVVYQKEVAPFKAVTRRLGQVMLEPLRAELEGHRDLILFPNDLLMYLPIHALTWRGPDGQDQFLAETHRVTYSTQHELPDVLMGEATPRAGAALVAVGNPDGSLPEAGGEVRSVGRLRAGTVVLEGAGATKDRLLAELKRQGGEFDLHLATHGVLDEKAPSLSYLLLAGSDDASRRLTLREVRMLSLRIRLAVLSACETARPGEIAPGVALITLAKAFSSGGARAVVASLWRVEEEATRDWMVALHRALAAGESRAASIQEAQSAVRSRVRTAHPYYWAGFILIGAR